MNQGIWTPRNIEDDSTLTLVDEKIISTIKTFEAAGKDCYPSNTTLAKKNALLSKNDLAPSAKTCRKWSYYGGRVRWSKKNTAYLLCQYGGAAWTGWRGCHDTKSTE